jgi:hypothetical protein
LEAAREDGFFDLLDHTFVGPDWADRREHR